ncbi:MAG: hypothetical protein ACYDBB_18240 [Armatimonadota bacterium]
MSTGIRCFVLLVGFLLLVASGASAAEKPAAPLKMLFLYRTNPMDAQYLEELKAAGITVTQRGLTEAITVAEFKSYNLVVIPDFLSLDDAYTVGATDVPTWWDVTLPNLRTYVAQGGGLLMTSFLYGGGEGLVTAMNRMLQPWGAAFRAVQILDPAHVAQVDPKATECTEKPAKSLKEHSTLAYCYTERIAKHPATAGVKRVYYPVCNLRWDDCYTTPPIVLSDRAWNPIVRAMNKSGVFNTKTDKGYQWLDSMGTDDVIAAVRTVGKGRVALLGINSYYTFFRPYVKEASFGENHHGAIDGLLLHKGDGTTRSDDALLLTNIYRWLAEPGKKAGFGGLTPPPVPAPPAPEGSLKQVLDWDTLQMPPTWRHRPIPARINGQMYYDEMPDVTMKGELKYYKALVGVHSSFSDGKGTIADFAKAAKQAGYVMIAFTETFEKLGGPARWEALKKECEKNTTADFVCLPGIDIADTEGGRYLIMGQPNYPATPWLSADGKYFTANNAMSLGFTTHLGVIARPQHSPHQYRMFKHFAGIAVATYKDGKLVDDGQQAYAWQVFSGSNPIPVAVHEVFSPAEVAGAAQTGFQQIMPSDSVTHAADYFRCGLAHFFDCPPRYFISEGPIIDTWTIFNKDMGKAEENRNRYRIALGARSEAPIKDISLYAEDQLYRRWTPNATSFKEQLDGYHAWQHHWYMTVTDANGKRAISPQVRNVPARYIFRCGDRQNWLGHVQAYYTATPMRPVDIHMPVKETKEGDSTAVFEKGSLLSPMLEFPLTSNRVVETDYILDQCYINAAQIGDIAYDAAPMRITRPAKLYEGRVRTFNFTPPGKKDDLDSVMFNINLKLRMDATRADDSPVWPWFYSVSGKYYVKTKEGWQAGDITGKTLLDLHTGDIVGNVVVLTNMRLAGNRLGLAAPAEKTVKKDDTFSARFLLLNSWYYNRYYSKPETYDVGKHAAELAKMMGFDGPTPYSLTLKRGNANPFGYLISTVAPEGGIAGDIHGGPMPYEIPLSLYGVNPRWTAGVWRSDAPDNIADQLAVSTIPFTDLSMKEVGSSITRQLYSGVGYTTLDVSKDAKFYAGNFITADNPDLFLNLESWTKDGISVEVNNPTDAAITATIQTPAEITTLKPLKKTITVPAGTTVRIKE